MSRAVQTFTIDWQGITLSVKYQPNWFSGAPRFDLDVAHIEVCSIYPDRAPLPFTETGYRSHFTNPAQVEHYGGAVAFVKSWLEEAALSPEWQRRQHCANQLSLF